MPINISSVVDKTQLHSELRGIDISMPLRTEGRTKDHTETWIICRLLATLSESNCFCFPLSLEHRERPDFLLFIGPTQVGVEVTESVSEQYVAYSKLAEREFPDVWLQPGHFRFGAPKITVDQMRFLLGQTQFTSPPWEGDSPEREWASKIYSVIDSKLTKLEKPDFSKFDENWLAIYDNLPLPYIELDKALRFLHPMLETCWSCNPAFTLVFIEHGPVILGLSCTGTRNFVLHDLW
jgi:hypothetical protein